MGINGLVFELRKPCCCLLWRLAHQTTCHPPSSPRALPFGIIPTCQGLFFPSCHSRMPGVERLFQETHVPLCRIGGKCGGFGAFTTTLRIALICLLGKRVNRVKGVAPRGATPEWSDGERFRSQASWRRISSSISVPRALA